MGTKRRHPVHRIPEPLHGEMRVRLRLMRKVRKLAMREVMTYAPGTLGGYELNDCSSMKLGDIMCLAREYEMSTRDFMNFLVGEEVPIRSAKGRDIDEILLYVSHADPQTRRMLLGMIKAIIGHIEELHRTSALHEMVTRQRPQPPLAVTVTTPSEGVKLSE